jgi:hypothetical protein
MPYVTMSINCANNVFVEGSVVGGLGESIRFRSRVNSCSGTITSTGCQIDITYYWEDTNFASGTSTTSIVSGSSLVIVTPTLEPISYFQINSASFNAGSCSGYSNTISIC